jgi:preprotein translocase subunit SecD
VTEPTPRQVLYALVAAGFHVVVVALIVGAGVTGAVSVSWTVAMAVLWLAVAAWSGLNWRRTLPVLLSAMGLFLFWAVATLLIDRS